VCDTITSQFISYYLPGFGLMLLQKSFKESLCCRTVSSFLKKHIDNFTIPKALASLAGQAFLINRSPEVLLFTINSNENFIDEEYVAISPMFSF